ncbi:MAG: peptide chain release factor N(5)-glutamine methyltransferase [Dehalococcoidia bacterium]|nr:peptide chain release factor N(5)-glutamine methyltransferase [Dehalococcoidia bacterium]
MRARAAARAAAAELAREGIPDPEFEAEYLVRQAAGLTRAQYFADVELPASAQARLRELLDRRLQREPAAYIAGTREFYGLDFDVGPGVLVPRPETELLVDAVLRECGPGGATIIDAGTGSGCIAVTVALRAPGAYVVGVDVSGDALRVARRNARRHGAAVAFVRGDLATAIRAADIVAANLPYIPSEEVVELEPEVRYWEPAVALDGGPDGTVLIRRLIDDCSTRLRPRLLALEVGFGQAGDVAAYAAANGARVEVAKDLAGIDRHVLCRWT